MKVTDREDWLPSIQKCHKLFTGEDYDNRPIEARILFYLQMLEDRGLLCSGKRVVDLGAGISWFDPLMKFLGSEPILVDDFGGGGGVDNADRTPAQKLLEKFRSEIGLTLIEQDILTTLLPFPDNSVDAITCFHCLEHWHNTPKHLFREIVRILKPGGFVFLATPNAANIRKRVTVLLGRNNWSPLEEWYHDEPVFRGHVREPVARDLRKLCEWNGFDVLRLHGRNFIGRDSHALAWIPRPLRHALAAISQGVLQFFPTLCSDLHIVAQKPA